MPVKTTEYMGGRVSVVVVGMGEGGRSESVWKGDWPVTGLHTWKGGCAGTVHVCLISSPKPR